MAYRLKKPRKNGATHLVMTPVQCLARIAAILPPPRFPLVRFAGVLAPSSSWRRAIVAMRPPTRRTNEAEVSPPSTTKANKKKARGVGTTAMAAPRDQTPRAPDGPTTSLGAGLLTPCYARIDWATLLRRIYLDDVLACACGGRRYVVAEINERDAIVSILNHLGLDPDPPAVARARDPTDDAA